MRTSKLRNLFLLVLLVSGQVLQAAHSTVHYYVDTGSAGGDGTTPGVAGATAAYASQFAFEAARNGDLAAADIDIVLHCNRTNGGGADTTVVVYDGGTTSATCYIAVTQDDFPATGIYNAAKYVLAPTDAIGLTISDQYFRVSGLQAAVTVTANNGGTGIYIGGIAAGGSDIRLDRLIVTGTCAGTGTGYGIRWNDADATVTLTNSIVYGFISGGDTGFRGISSDNCAAAGIFNCTSSGNYRGISHDAGTGTITNCAVFNNTDDFGETGTPTITYCASDDNPAGTGNVDLNENASGEWAACFTNYAAGDFSVKDASSPLYNTGVADPGGASQPDTDIIATARPQVGSWDIGAFELLGTASVPIFMHYQWQN
jgi:hypothetical protein